MEENKRKSLIDENKLNKNGRNDNKSREYF